MRAGRLLVLVCLLLTACASSAPTSTTPEGGARLPTRRPPATPTATPFALSAKAYYQRGVEQQRMGDVDGARQHFTWAIQMDPEFAPAYVSRGSLHLAEGDPDRALADADTALEIQPTARAHLLRAEALRTMARYARAWRAYEEALTRDPGLRDDTFPSRWAVAQAVEDEGHLSELAAEYAAAHPDDPLRHYYGAWVSLQSGAYEETLTMLVTAMGDSGDPPALLWYALGRAYMGIEAWQEAITSLEVARGLVAEGDNSLVIHTGQPAAELFVALGRAYLGAGRCADAEATLAHGMALGAPKAENMAALQQARSCPTPTPPPTPTPGG
jgi:hypothetical protein